MSSKKSWNPFKVTAGCGLLDYRADQDHNRLVVSLVGAPEPIQDALIQAAKIAVDNIDMNHHQGGHPRVGAVDVVPFIPIRGRVHGGMRGHGSRVRGALP